MSAIRISSGGGTRGAIGLALVCGLTACERGSGYTIVADLGVAIIIVASPSLSHERLLAVAKHACGARPTCQARVWTDRQWAPKNTDWPPGARENIALIFNRFPTEGGEYHRWNCRRYPGTSSNSCIPF